MTDPELTTAVLRVLGTIAPEIDLSAIAPDVPLREQVDIDSMDFLNFVVALHDTLGVEIPEADYPHLATLAGCVAYLAPRLPTAPPAR